MEQRRENRFKPNQLATVTVLGFRPGPVLQACIVDLSGSGMRLRSNVPVPCGTHVAIDVEGLSAQGSVCRCEPLGDDAYEFAVEELETAPKI